MESSEKLSAKDIDVFLQSRKMLLVNSAFNPQFLLPFSGNVFWEELTCVGYNPAISRLEAVVNIKQQTGYSGDLCSTGSTEFVRFFIDWHNLGIWQNLGTASFKAHDISDAPPGPQHPVNYMVYMKLNDKQHRRLCSQPVLPRIRAVLSWNVPSSPVDPHAPVGFGNAIEARIQLRPRTIFDQYVNADKLLATQKVFTSFYSSLSLNNTTATEPQPIPWSILKEQYQKLEVADHRLIYQAIHPLITSSNSFTALAGQQDISSLGKLQIDPNKVAEALFAQKFDTTYEELTCVGLNTSTDLLGAVIKIKKPGGYSGSLCYNGSNEYVAFWADWNNNGVYDQYLGTASVKVHDIPTVKKDNELYYAVSLPFNVQKHLKTCNVPNVVRIRAVLSWAVPPSSTNPNIPVHWGNVKDVLVQIRPGKIGSDLVPLIEAISGVTLDTIDVNTVSTAYGLGNTTSILGPDNFNTFGGEVYITGEFLNSGPSRNVKYKMEFDDGSGWQAMVASQTYKKEYPGNIYVYETQTPPDGWFEYIPDGTTVGVVNKLLASWPTGTRYGIHKLRVLYTIDKISIFTQEFSAIRINNVDFFKSPTANNVVDPASTFDLVIDGGDCHSYDKASPIINGHLRVLHEVFGYWTLGLEPETHTHGVLPGPLTYRPVITLSDIGDANFAWNLDTTGLDKCGYTITLRGYDRTIVNGSLSGRHSDSKSVGFAVL